MTAKSLQHKTIFWSPSLETIQKIGDDDTVTAIQAAHYRFAASMADLERHFDAKASELRSALVAEVRQLYAGQE